MIKYAHTNLIAKNWKTLAKFYQQVFECEPVLPERSYSGYWLADATGIENPHLTGIHLRLPGYDDNGPTLEIFQYSPKAEVPHCQPNTQGFSHIAFAVDDVSGILEKLLKNGGTQLGRITEREVPNVGCLTFVYARDPEGNIIEIQNWQ